MFYQQKFSAHADSSRHFQATNSSQEHNNNNNVNKNYLKFNDGLPYVLSTTAANVAPQHGSVLTENDKLPWPTPYENVERELKWKIIKSPVLHPRNFVSSNYTHDSNSRTLSQQSIETTSSVSVLPTNTYTTLTNAIPSTPYQPYVFESILTPPIFFPTVKIPEFSTNLPDDAFAQPIDNNAPNITSSDLNYGKDSQTIHVQRLNKE